MPIIDVHGKKVHIEAGSHSLEHALKYLNENPDNAKAHFEAAHHDRVTNMAHFDVHGHAGYNGATKFTLVHTGHDQYELRKSHHHMF